MGAEAKRNRARCFMRAIRPRPRISRDTMPHTKSQNGSPASTPFTVTVPFSFESALRSVTHTGLFA